MSLTRVDTYQECAPSIDEASVSKSKTTGIASRDLDKLSPGGEITSRYCHRHIASPVVPSESVKIVRTLCEDLVVSRQSDPVGPAAVELDNAPTRTTYPAQEFVDGRASHTAIRPSEAQLPGLTAAHYEDFEDLCRRLVDDKPRAIFHEPGLRCRLGLRLITSLGCFTRPCPARLVIIGAHSALA